MHTGEDEDLDPVGPPDPRALFTKMAVRFNVPGGMTDALWAYTRSVVDKCAAVGNAYGDGEDSGNAGDAIRAFFYDY